MLGPPRGSGAGPRGCLGLPAAVALAGGANSIARAVRGAVDTFVWQMLASVVFPSFIINRLVTLIVTLQATVDLPEALQADWIATVLGLVAIPLLITPLDTLTHWILNGSLRKVNKQILD